MQQTALFPEPTRTEAAPITYRWEVYNPDGSFEEGFDDLDGVRDSYEDGYIFDLDQDDEDEDDGYYLLDTATGLLYPAGDWPETSEPRSIDLALRDLDAVWEQQHAGGEQ